MQTKKEHKILYQAKRIDSNRIIRAIKKDERLKSKLKKNRKKREKFYTEINRKNKLVTRL